MCRYNLLVPRNIILQRFRLLTVWLYTTFWSSGLKKDLCKQAGAYVDRYPLCDPKSATLFTGILINLKSAFNEELYKTYEQIAVTHKSGGKS